MPFLVELMFLMEAHVSRLVGEGPSRGREADMARAKPLNGEERGSDRSFQSTGRLTLRYKCRFR